MNELIIGPQQGWQCPTCHRVYSPSTSMCYYCPPQIGLSTISNKFLTIEKFTVPTVIEKSKDNDSKNLVTTPKLKKRNKN